MIQSPRRKPLRLSWLRWSLVAVFPLGWLATNAYFPHDGLTYFFLSVAAALACAVALAALGKDFVSYPHLWVILVLFILGYFVRFYALLLYVQAQDVTFIASNFGTTILPYLEPAGLLAAYHFTVVAFVPLCVLFPILRWFPRSARSLRRPSPPSPDIPIYPVRNIQLLFALAILCTATSTYLFLLLDLTGTYATAPDHIAGILKVVRTGLIPLLLLATVWLSDRQQLPGLSRLAAATLILQSILFDYLTGSKGPLLLAVIGLSVCWLLTQRWNGPRALSLLSLLPAAAVYSTAIAMTRGTPYGQASFLTRLGVAAQDLLSQNTFDSFGQLALSTVLRVQGIDPLFYLIRYHPTEDLGRSLNLLFSTSTSVNRLYDLQVLQVDSSTTSFSTGLLGYFYFVFGSLELTVLATVAFVLGWHFIFNAIQRSSLYVRPIALSLIVLTLTLYTSEGLDGLPEAIAIDVATIFIGEFLLRRHVAARTKPPPHDSAHALSPLSAPRHRSAHT